jgi:NitT/TauT family transport system permease protein
MIRRTIVRLSPPIALFLIVASVWEALVYLLEIPPVLLPGPIRIGEAMFRDAAKLLPATLVTASAAMLGLGLSSVVGVLIAVAFSQSSIIRRSCYPYAIFLQTVPIVGIAPLINVWIGEGFAAIVAIAAIISLFPVITNATDGMLGVPENLHELFVMNRASRWQMIWHLQLPNAMPRILTGVKIASGAAVLGAIVGEFFSGAVSDSQGLGYLILSEFRLLHIDSMFATILICTTLGVTIFFTVSYMGSKLFLRWYDSQDSN